MRQPLIYVNNQFLDHVCPLRKALYGLNQGPHT